MPLSPVFSFGNEKYEIANFKKFEMESPILSSGVYHNDPRYPTKTPVNSPMPSSSVADRFGGRKRMYSCTSNGVINNIPKQSVANLLMMSSSSSLSSSSSNLSKSIGVGNDLRRSLPDLNKRTTTAVNKSHKNHINGDILKNSDGESDDGDDDDDCDSGEESEGVDDELEIDDRKLFIDETFDFGHSNHNEIDSFEEITPKATATATATATPIVATPTTVATAPRIKQNNVTLPPGVNNVLFTANGPVDSPISTLRRFTSDWDLDSIMNGDPRQIVRGLAEFSAINKIKTIPIDDKESLLKEYFRGIRYELNDVVKACMQRFAHWDLDYIWQKGTKHFDSVTLCSVLEAKIRNTTLPGKAVSHQTYISDELYYCDRCGAVRMVTCDLCDRHWCVSAGCLERYRKRGEIVCFLTKYCETCNLPMQNDIVSSTKPGFCVCSVDCKLDCVEQPLMSLA